MGLNSAGRPQVWEPHVARGDQPVGLVDVNMSVVPVAGGETATGTAARAGRHRVGQAPVPVACV
jgi:hypothetical protein